MLQKKLLLILLWASVAFCGEITLVENGQANASIVISSNAGGVVKLAARELSNTIREMTGAELPVGEKPSEKVNIYLGFGDASTFKPDQFVIQARGDRIDIYGRDDNAPRADSFNLFYDNPWKGTYTGVCDFLDRLGVRWFAPGEKNKYTPKVATLRIPEMSIEGMPAFADRQIADVWDFTRVMPDAKRYVDNSEDIFLWGVRNRASTRNMVPGCHSEHSLQLFKNEEWLAHPERHQLMKNGKRNPNYSCWTDPAVAELWMKAADAYFSGKKPQDIGLDIPTYLHSKWPFPFIAPDEFMIDTMDNSGDNDGLCHCQRCQDFRVKYPCHDDSEILWNVKAQVARMLEEKHPGKFISSLVYGEQKVIPEHVRLPQNIRVRICISGPKEMDLPNRLAADLELVEGWGKLLGKDNLPLWTYQCVSHGRTLPGIPDTYPRNIQKFAQLVRPLTAGMYLENHALTHTFRNLDVYMFMRIMWNPDLDLETELKEYFSLVYGAGGKDAQELFAVLEKNWTKIWQMCVPDVPGKSPELFGSAEKRKEMKEKVWSQVYSVAEMDRLDALLQRAEKSVEGDPVSKARVALLRTYLLDVMLSERNEIMKKEDIRKDVFLDVTATDASVFPGLEEWAAAKSYHLRSAVRLVRQLQIQGSFKALASKDYLFIKADLEEPQIAQSLTNPAHVTGSEEIWKDNDIELFFHAMKTRKFWQICINDNQAWASQTDDGAMPRWIPMKGLRIRTEKNAASWIAEVSIPLVELQMDGGELRFNFCRERNIKGEKTEYSTWSPLGLLGNWHDPANYGTVRFVK